MLPALIANILAAAQEHAPGPTPPGADLAVEHGAHTPTPPAEVIFHIASIPVTNTVFTAWFVIVILVLLAWAGTRRMSMMPTGLQNFWELMVETWIGIVEQTMGKKGRRFMPIVATLFMYIVFSNWLGILPGIGELTISNGEGEVVPVFRSANSDLNLTAAMAVVVIVVAEFFEFRSLGPGGYIKGMVWPNFLRWLEIFTRPLSLAFRLFGNIFAGEVLVVTMLGIAPFVVFAFLGLELFVGFIQAIVFAMLALVFFTMATLHEHAHEDVPDHSLADGAEHVLETTPGHAESVL